jgi:hypothetical protein
MDIGIVMNTMRDPAGVPAHPVLFQVLMILTWVLHIAFVHLTLGSAGLAIFSFHRRTHHPYWERISMAMTKVAKVSVSLLIVLGVAPLLFTQVIYDPQWYVSNVISGRWAIGFIVTLIIGYCSWFVFYYANHAGAKKHIGLFAWLALLIFCLDGLIMHALSYQALLPDQWMHWYAPDGIPDTSGAKLHAIHWPRYIFIMSLSIPVTGVFLIAYAHYFASRSDREPAYREFAHKTGQKMAVWGFGFSLIPLLCWQFTHPSASALISHPVGWVLFLSIIGMLCWMYRLPGDCHPYLPVAGGFGILSLLALWREVIRVRHLAPFHYDISTYTVHADIPSTLLFFATITGVGGLVGGYYLTLLYKAGRVQGVYTATPGVARLGSATVGILLLWIAVFFAYGIVIWLRNSTT